MKAVLVAALGLLLVAPSVWADEADEADVAAVPPAKAAFEPDLAQVNGDLMKRARDGLHLTLGIWVPHAYWALAIEQTSMKADDAAKLLEKVELYTVFLVAVADQDGPDELTFRSAEELGSSLSMTDSAGEMHRPIRWGKLPSELAQLLQLLQPIFESSMGAFLEGFKVFVFPATNGAGVVIADPTGDGKVSIDVLGTPLVWRLPIGAMVPPKRCPTSGDLLSGGYRYCPYHGAKLLEE